jgi:hypothetical protein
MEEGPLARLWAWLSGTELDLPRLEAGFGQGSFSLKLVAELKTRPTLREQVRRAVAAHLSAFLRQVQTEFENLEKRAITLGRSGLLVILDSLEKLQGTSESFDKVLTSAERVFTNGAPYLRLPVHVLYTVPPALLLRMPSADVRYLPMLKLHKRDHSPFAEGFEAARNIILKRVPDQVLAEIFGAPLVETRLREMIDWSGGYPRELVRLLQSILSIEPFPVSERAFRSVLTHAGDAYSRVVLGNGQAALDLLARVVVTQQLVIGDGERELTDRLLSGNIILRYLNDSEWADIHPALLRQPLLLDAIERFRREEAAKRAGTPPAAPAAPSP